jgi:hypothetical protein
MYAAGPPTSARRSGHIMVSGFVLALRRTHSSTWRCHHNETTPEEVKKRSNRYRHQQPPAGRNRRCNLSAHPAISSTVAMRVCLPGRIYTESIHHYYSLFYCD